MPSTYLINQERIVCFQLVGLENIENYENETKLFVHCSNPYKKSIRNYSTANKSFNYFIILTNDI